MTTKMARNLWFFGMLALLCVLTGCPKDTEEGTKVYDTGTATGQSIGGTDQPLFVKVTMNAGVITAVVITGEDHNSYGKPVMDAAPTKILEYQDFDHIDAVTGATITRAAIREAGKKAVEKIKKGQFDPQ
jgi:major membrane immunogen (membrane-anchored lipoprotein)